MQDILLIATNNAGKAKEFRELLVTLTGVKLVTPAEVGLMLKPVESGETYRANAEIKAREFSQASGLPCLADDSGLEVESLAGAPGLYSARYGEGRANSDQDRRSLLLEALTGHARPWGAQFVCALSFCATARGVLEHWEGTCPGEVIPVARGHGGFGYDPIFELTDRGATMAELPAWEKNSLSHRARAVQAALPFLRGYYGIK